MKNIFVGFDLRENAIKIWSSDRFADKSAENEVGILRFSERVFSDAFFIEARGLLQAYLADKPELANQPAYVVLPDEAVGFNTFNLPNLPKAKLEQAFETELENQFEIDLKNKKINKFSVSHDKEYTVVGAVYFDKQMINNIYKMLSSQKLFPRQTTYKANAVLNGVLANTPRVRNKSFIFADIHENYTEIVVSSKGKTMGFATIPHGTLLLKDDVVADEYMSTDHEVADIAVINAREIAKARALTTAEEETEEDFDEEINVEGSDETVEEGGAAESENAETTEETTVVKTPKVKVYKKMPKRYPKFMLRETPETAEGILFENFRIIAKWLLLYARQAELTEYISNPEFILVNMPENLRFLLDEMNAEQGDGIKFKPFTSADKLSSQQKENLEFVGCLYAKQFNKNHNF